MLAEESLREGWLDESLAQVQAEVRRDPSNAKSRVFLFQLLAVLGQWDRAMAQLNLIGDLDAGALAMVHVYREAIRCEVCRSEIFAGMRSPMIFGETEEWIDRMIEAARHSGQGEYARAQRLREQAFDVAPVTSGTMDGEPFEWIADADTRLGPILEAVVSDRYYWIPFDRIREIRIEPPADLRDLVWMPAFLRLSNSGEAVAALIPTRYPDSHASENPRIVLARKTVWIEQETDVHIGMGQRMLATNVAEYPLMDTRTISLEASSDKASN